MKGYDLICTVDLFRGYTESKVALHSASRTDGRTLCRPRPETWAQVGSSSYPIEERPFGFLHLFPESSTIP
jgi:hypothetical protein